MKKITCPKCNSTLPKAWILLEADSVTFDCKNCKTTLMKKGANIISLILYYSLILILLFLLEIFIDFFITSNGFMKNLARVIAFVTVAVIIFTFIYIRTEVEEILS